MEAQDLKLWQDKVAVLSSYDGERTTAHVLYVDVSQHELVVDVIASNRPYKSKENQAFTISTAKIIAIRPADSGFQPQRSLVPTPDPCRLQRPFSPLRLAVLFALFLLAVPGAVIIFIFLSDRPLGVQTAAVVVYSAAVALYTFASNRGSPAYLASCPVVRRELPQLGWRHLGFLSTLLLVQTVALNFRGRLPASWIVSHGRDLSLFVTFMGVFSVGLGCTEIFSNRSFLKRAHLRFAPDI